MEYENCDIICKLGLSLSYYRSVRAWLDAEDQRRLFFIDDLLDGALEQEEDAPVLLNDRRVKIFPLESPLQKESLARQLGKLAAFRRVAVIGDGWEERIAFYQRESELLISDASDFGVKALTHMLANFRKPLRLLAALKDSKKGVPAVIVGAGPSLAERSEWIDSIQKKALIIAAGTALSAIRTPPHLAVAVCPQNPVLHNWPKTPLCIQGRVHPDTISEGPLFWAPDSHFPFETAATNQEPFLNGGWTVGNTAVSVALHLGCNPIVAVGLDFCYRGREKYADGLASDAAPLIETADRNGKIVWTQKDWLAAADWMEQCARSHPQTQFYNAGTEGLAFWTSLPQVQWAERENLALDFAPFVNGRIDSSAIEPYLETLWRTWEPIFERELMVDRQPLPLYEKLEIQKELFLEQARGELIGAFTPNGLLRSYYTSGKIHTLERFREGIREGVQEAYYESGKLRTKENYVHGVRRGEAVLYWPDGKIKRREYFDEV